MCLLKLLFISLLGIFELVSCQEYTEPSPSAERIPEETKTHLLTQMQSKLPQALYDLIANHPKVSTAQKNAIMHAVKAAMDKLPKDKIARDSDIDQAVSKNGNHTNLAKEIKAQLDLIDPISVPPTLLTRAQSQLEQSIYDVIANHTQATILQKNAIMRAVKAAMDRLPKHQVSRDSDITQAVTNNGNHQNLALAIKTRVDIVDPIVATIDCAGAGNWEFGTKSTGTMVDTASPFIDEAVPGSCSFNAGEKDLIVNTTINNATGTPGQRIAIFTLGAPGCGKSSAIDIVLNELGYTKNQFVYIDPDDGRARMSAFQAATRIPSTVCPTKFRAYASATSWCLNAGRAIRDALLNRVHAENRSYIFDTPCTDSNYCSHKIRDAHQRGFTVYVVAVWAQAQTCAARGLSRAFSTGRYAAPNFITQAHGTIQNARPFNNLATLARDAFIFDNDQPNITKKTFQKQRGHCDVNERSCIYYAPETTAQYWLMDWKDYGGMPATLDANGSIVDKLVLGANGPSIQPASDTPRFYWEKIDTTANFDVRAGNKFYLLVKNPNSINTITLRGHQCNTAQLRSYGELKLLRVDCPAAGLPVHFYRNVYNLAAHETYRFSPSSGSILDQNFSFANQHGYQSHAQDFWAIKGLSPSSPVWGNTPFQAYLSECSMIADKLRYALGFFKSHESNPILQVKIANTANHIAMAEAERNGNNCHFYGRQINCYGNDPGCEGGWGKFWSQQGEFSVRNAIYAKYAHILSPQANVAEVTNWNAAFNEVANLHKIPVYSEPQEIWGGLQAQGQMNKVGRIWQFIMIPVKVTVH